MNNDHHRLICERFNDLHWHDSELIGVQVQRNENNNTDDVHLNIRLLANAQLGNYVWKKARMVIKECTILKLDLDLDGKRVCSDQIALATCAAESTLKAQIEQKQLKSEVRPLSEYLHFRILFIPPGGEINIFAKDFELTMLA